MNVASALAALAVLPLATGPLPEEGRRLTLTLCDGGAITIPIDGEDDDPKRDCHQQACHAGNCREKSKRAR